MPVNVIWNEWEKGLTAFRREQVKEGFDEGDYAFIDELEACETEAKNPISNEGNNLLVKFILRIYCTDLLF